MKNIKNYLKIMVFSTVGRDLSHLSQLEKFSTEIKFKVT